MFLVLQHPSPQVNSYAGLGRLPKAWTTSPAERSGKEDQVWMEIRSGLSDGEEG